MTATPLLTLWLARRKPGAELVRVEETALHYRWADWDGSGASQHTMPAPSAAELFQFGRAEAAREAAAAETARREAAERAEAERQVLRAIVAGAARDGFLAADGRRVPIAAIPAGRQRGDLARLVAGWHGTPVSGVRLTTTGVPVVSVRWNETDDDSLDGSDPYSYARSGWQMATRDELQGALLAAAERALRLRDEERDYLRSLRRAEVERVRACLAAGEPTRTNSPVAIRLYGRQLAALSGAADAARVRGEWYDRPSRRHRITPRTPAGEAELARLRAEDAAAAAAEIARRAARHQAIVAEAAARDRRVPPPPAPRPATATAVAFNSLAAAFAAAKSK